MQFEQALERLYSRIAELASLAIVRLPDLVIALVIGLFVIVVAGRLSGLTQRVTRRAGGTTSLSQFFSRAVSSAVLILGFVLVLNILGLGQIVISFIASLGLVGLILGFALQDITRQLAAGTLLLTLRPFEIGDQIKVKDFQGEVVDVKLLSTVLRSKAGVEVLIPNADVYTSPIMNYSRYGMQRFDITFNAPLTVNLPQLEARIRNLLAGRKDVADVPAPDVLWPAIENDGIAVAVRFWVDCRACDTDYVYSEVVADVSAVVRSLSQSEGL